MAYIYDYLRQDDTPYYIGKGKDKRAWASHKKHGISTPKDLSRIVIMEDNLTEIGALALERFYIRWYGRKVDGGILMNKTLGGDGSEAPKTEETKIKMRKPKSESHRRKFIGNQNAKGRIKSPEEIEYFRQLHIGRKNTVETIDKMKSAQKIAYMDPNRRKLQSEVSKRGWETRRKNLNVC